MKEKLIELLITAQDLITLTRKAEFLIANGAVVPVRCKDCHFSDPCDLKGKVWCLKMCRYMKEDGFCSEGNGDYK